ncbi:serum response factor-binding protein 1 isoform X2 [Rana temporaria]|nr:serum response factor-binding protein 1 isoform X2 [Rana temporaria]
MNFEKVCKKPNSTIETRALARLATHPLLMQKISTIKDAVKAFKEARKIAAEQEAKIEETYQHDEPVQIVGTDTDKQCKQKKTKQNQTAKDSKKIEENSLDNSPCKTLHNETDFVASNQQHEENILDSHNGLKQASLTVPKAEMKVVEGVPEKPTSITVPKVSAEQKIVEGVPEKPASLTFPKVSAQQKIVGVPEKPASITVPKVSAQQKIVGVPEKPASITVPKVSAQQKIVGVPEKPASVTVPKVSAQQKIVGVPEKPASITVPKVLAQQKIAGGVPEKPASITVPKVSAEKKPVVGDPEKQKEKKIKNKLGLGKKTPIGESGSDSSDIEDSDNEDKEYFDDSTEERFYKQSSGFEDSDSDSEDDFFIGKVRRTKKKKSSKKPPADKEEKLPTDSTKSAAGGMKSQKENPAPKSVKLESVFCTSLSNTKQKSSFMKREPTLPPVRNKQAAFPQAPKFVKKPQAGRNSMMKSQGKPEPTLHPSWEASRKRKAQSQIAVFQGKKIVFDD